MESKEIKEGYLTRMVDALTRTSEEGRSRLRKASGSCQASFDPGISECGNAIHSSLCLE
jgi:hypothetical protein